MVANMEHAGVASKHKKKLNDPISSLMPIGRKDGWCMAGITQSNVATNCTLATTEKLV